MQNAVFNGGGEIIITIIIILVEESNIIDVTIVFHMTINIIVIYCHHSYFIIVFQVTIYIIIIMVISRQLFNVGLSMITPSSYILASRLTVTSTAVFLFFS